MSDGPDGDAGGNRDDEDGDPLSDRLGEDETPDDADPFERIGEGTGPRHGDPFDSFADADPEAGSNGADAAADDPDDRPDPARDGLPSGVGDETGDDPFTEFDEPTTDPFGEGDTVFEHAGAGDDGVWERMESTDAAAEATPGKRYVDVDKHSYCETCEYFSEPPEISCSHEGTEILEFVDMETVRVTNCPIVEERKALEDDE